MGDAYKTRKGMTSPETQIRMVWKTIRRKKVSWTEDRKDGKPKRNVKYQAYPVQRLWAYCAYKGWNMPWEILTEQQAKDFVKWVEDEHKRYIKNRNIKKNKVSQATARIKFLECHKKGEQLPDEYLKKFNDWIKAFLKNYDRQRPNRDVVSEEIFTLYTDLVEGGFSKDEAIQKIHRLSAGLFGKKLTENAIIIRINKFKKFLQEENLT